MPDGGTGFEELIPPEQVPPKPEGKYILEACLPGALGFQANSIHRPQTNGVRMAVLAVGDLVLIHGSVLHKSEKNTSPHTRFAYTFHMIESPPYAQYDEKNWLQPTSRMPFSKILGTPNPEVLAY